MTDDLSSPHRPVRLLARSQSSTFQISLTCVFPSCFRSSSLPFPWYIRSQYFPQYVFTISPHHMPVPDQSSLGDLFGSLRHSCCSSDVFIPDLVFACHSFHCPLFCFTKNNNLEWESSRFATRDVFDLNAGVLPQMSPPLYGGGDINR